MLYATPHPAGAIPSSLGLHASLEALDVRNNQLTTLPDEWSSGADVLIAKVCSDFSKDIHFLHTHPPTIHAVGSPDLIDSHPDWGFF